MSISLIAGSGILPVEIAKKLKSQNASLLVLALRKDLETFKPYAEKIVYLSTPNLGRGVREIKNFGADKLIMAGTIPKRTMYYLPFATLFDQSTRSVLKNSLKDDHSLLGSIVEAFENENIKVIPYWQILPEFSASEGKLSKRLPTEKEFNDIKYAQKILSVTLPCSFGQSICVADGAVVAVEAMEGTDEMIKRCGKLSGHGVIVKMMKVNQDMRYDLPIVGVRTLENMKEAGLTCLAVESGKTLIMEPEKFFELAEKFNISVWGIVSPYKEVTPSDPSDSLREPPPHQWGGLVSPFKGEMSALADRGVDPQGKMSHLCDRGVDPSALWAPSRKRDG